MNNKEEQIKDWNEYEKQLVDKAHEEAHQAWLNEKQVLMENLEQVAKTLYSKDMQFEAYVVNRTLKFIKYAKD